MQPRHAHRRPQFPRLCLLLARRCEGLSASPIFGMNLVRLLGRQSDFCQTIGNPLDVLFPLERLPAEMFIEGVLWIDLIQFVPDAPGLVDLTEMTKSGSH